MLFFCLIFRDALLLIWHFSNINKVQNQKWQITTIILSDDNTNILC